MVNISALNNLTPFVPNTSLISNSNKTIANLITNANTVSDGYYGLLVMMILFLFLLYLLVTNTGIFKMDFIKGLVFASGFTLITGVVMIVSGLITNYRHVIWFALIFSLASVASFFLKKKGL